MNRLITPLLAARSPRRAHPSAGCAAVIMLVAALIGCADGQHDGSVAQRVSCAKAPTPDPLTRDAGLQGRIVWASDRADGNFELYMMRADGSGVRRLTRTPANEFAPAWSPDGTKIAFVSLAGLSDDEPASISVMDADGSIVRRLTPRERGTGAPTWSPDGTHIAFSGPGDDIHAIRGDGEARRQLADVNGSVDWVSWSPHGDAILFTSSTGGGAEELWTVRRDGSYQTRLLHGMQGAQGVWSPDGRSIAFASSRDGDPNASDPLDWNEEIYVASLEGSSVTRVTNIAGNDHWPPAWSPNGTHIAFTSDGCHDNSEILITDSRGNTLLNATHHPSHDAFPSWHR